MWFLSGSMTRQPVAIEYDKQHGVTMLKLPISLASEKAFIKYLLKHVFLMLTAVILP